MKLPEVTIPASCRELPAVRVRAAAAALALATALASQPPQPVAGRITSASGEPAANTWVYLVRARHAELPPGVSGCFEREDPHITSSLTDESGRFRIAIDSHAPAVLFAQRGEAEFTTLVHPVQSGSFLDLRLASPRRASGVVTDADGEPLAGAEVIVEVRPKTAGHAALWSYDLATTVPPLRFSGTTGAKGQYYISVPRHGTLVTRVRHEECEIVIDGFGDVQIDQTAVVEPPLSEGKLRLSATLIDVSNAPLANVALAFARPRPSETVQHRVQLETWCLDTDAKGQLAWTGVADGVPTAGWVRLGDRFVPLMMRKPDGHLALGEVEVSGNYAIRGRITGSNRAPAAGAWVFVRPEIPMSDLDVDGRAVRLAMSRVLVTDRGGRFHAGDLMPGRYHVVVHTPGSRPMRAIATAQHSADETLTLELPPPIVVRGVVTDAAGRPLPGASVQLRQDPRTFERRDLRFGGALFEQSTRTNEVGEFQFADLPDDAQFVMRAFTTQNGKLVHASVMDVPLDGERLQVELTPGR